MPIYEYQCPACKGKIEERRPIELRDMVIYCPKCGIEAKLIKTPSGTSFVMKI